MAMSFADIYAEHRGAVYRMARKWLRDPATADDVTADTFLVLTTRPGPHTRGGAPGDVRAFLLGVCANLIRRIQRAAARRSELLSRYRAESQSCREDAELSSSRQALVQRVWRALHELPEEQRNALLLTCVEERTAAEAARVCNVPEATIRTRVFHARRKLRKSVSGTSFRRVVRGALVIAILFFVAAGLARAARPLWMFGRSILHRLHSDKVTTNGSPVDFRAGGERCRAPERPFVPALENLTRPVTAEPGRTSDSAPHGLAVTPVKRPGQSILHADGRPPSTADRPAQAKAAVRAEDPEALYEIAHHAHFVDHDYAAALRTWDAYLARGGGLFTPDARYNRAVALAHVGRVEEARAALAVIAQGQDGAYRRDDARRILDRLHQITLP